MTIAALHSMPSARFVKGASRLRTVAFRLASLFAAYALLTPPTWADANPVANGCAGAAVDSIPDSAIDECTRLIRSGELSHVDAADVYKTRGLAFHRKKDYDRAIQDYQQAIRLRPDDARLLTARAGAYQENRQYERALADYEAAAHADSSVNVDRSKAFLLFYLGRMTQSAEAFERYTRSHPADLSVILFRYLAEAKIGNSLAAARALEFDAAKFTRGPWPAPLLDFHVGKIAEPAMFAAANDPDPKIKQANTCIANFHAGVSRLFRAYLGGAIPLLRAAATKDCPSEFHESHAAAAELQRLGQR